MATIFIRYLPEIYQDLANQIDKNEDLHNQHNINRYANPAVKGDGMLSSWEFKEFAQKLPSEVEKYYPFDSNPEARAKIIIGRATLQNKSDKLLGKILAYFRGS